MFFKSGTILQACYLSTVKHPTGCVTFIGEEAAVCHFQLKLRDVALESQRCVAVICVALQFTDREVYLCIFYACSGLVLHKHERHQCTEEQMKHFSVSICRSDLTSHNISL